MKQKIRIIILFITIGVFHKVAVFAQSTNKPLFNRSQIIDQSGKHKDSITKHQWAPGNIPDSLLFNGIEKYTFPKSTLTFTPPKSFRKDNQGDIVHDWTGSSIQCTIVNAEYASLLKTIHKETFVKQGYTYINQYLLTTKQGKEGTIFLIGFKSSETEYERIVFFIGHNGQTAWVSINYPLMMKTLLYETLENCLTTIEF